MRNWKIILVLETFISFYEHAIKLIKLDDAF